MPSSNSAIKFLVCPFLSILIAAQPLFAWNDRGHMVVARIAYRQLSDPERAKIHAILKQHPHYESYLAKNRPDEAAEEEWVFLRAATWCDSVRPPKGFMGDVAANPKYKFHRGPWHYINLPYRPGMANASGTPLSAETDAVRQLELTMSVLKGGADVDPDQVAGISKEANRAVRLCWLFHVVGDLHQPLHSVALVDPQRFPQPPHGDEGGNKIAIRTARSAKPIKLHAYWDQLVGFDSRFPLVRKLAEEIMSDAGMTPESLRAPIQQKSFNVWAVESYDVAVSKAYNNGNLQFAVWDDFEQQRITAAQVPELSAEYETTAVQVARQRIALAGYRLAERLQEIP